MRELDNVMQRALILSGGKGIGPESVIFDEAGLDAALSGREASSGAAPVLEQRQDQEAEAAASDPVRDQKIPSGLGGELKQQEYQIILDALIEFRGNRQMVSEKLGISPRTLRYKIAKMRDEGMIIPG